MKVKSSMKTGIIDVGGGFRDIYGAGVLDWCLDNGIFFDYGIGVSAGSANLISYLAGQRGRNYRFYTEYIFRKAYASMENFLSCRSYVDLDYAYSTLSNHDGEYPLDYPAFERNPAAFVVVCCNAETGEAVYFDKSHIRQDHYDVLKASSALPIFCMPYELEGIKGLDGGIADPIPVLKAFEDGCDRVVLILTRPVHQLREQKKDVLPARMLARSYPRAAERLLERYRTYNDSLEIAKTYAQLGKLLIVAPDDICGLSTLSKSREKLEILYQKGLRDAQAIGDFLK